MVRAALVALALLIALPAFAVRPGEQLADPALENRARKLSAELRCLVCQNQSIEDSDAPLAQDLRRLVRERIAAGDSDPAIRDFLVARYGAFVLLKPPVNLQTLLLWAFPGLALVAGGFAAWRLFRRREDEPGPEALAEASLSEGESRELQGLIERNRKG